MSMLAATPSESAGNGTEETAVVRDPELTPKDASICAISPLIFELVELRRCNEQLLGERNTALATVLDLQKSLAAELTKVAQLTSDYRALQERFRDTPPSPAPSTRSGRRTTQSRIAPKIIAL